MLYGTHHQIGTHNVVFCVETNGNPTSRRGRRRELYGVIDKTPGHVHSRNINALAKNDRIKHGLIKGCCLACGGNRLCWCLQL